MNEKRPFYKNNALILSTIIFFLVSSTLLYILILRKQLLPDWLITHKVLVFVLWYLDVTLLIIFTIILVRYIVKLVLVRRSRAYAFRLRTRVALSLTGMILVPIFYLFFVATDLIVHTSPLPEDLTTLLSSSKNVAEAYTRNEVDELKQIGSRLTSRLTTLDLEEWPDAASRFVADSTIQAVEVYQEHRPLFSNVKPPFDNTQTFRVPGSFLKEITQYGEGMLIEETGGLWLVRVGFLLKRDEENTQVVISRVFDEGIGRDRAVILTGAQAADQFRLEHKTLTTTRILIFLLLTLGVTFAAVWYGSHISHYLTNPLRVLLDATKRVSSGDYSVHVEEGAGDEWYTLMTQFNQMTLELENYRTLLVSERSKLQQILEVAPVGILTLTAGGKIENLNPAASTILRLSPDPSGEAALPEKIEESLVKFREENSQKTTSTLHLDGSHLEVNLIDLPGGGTLLLLEDLTQLVRAQQLATWQEAAKQIAHELKNPLTPIKLAAERLMHRSRENSADADLVDRTCQTVLSEVDHLKKLVDGFLQYARLPSPSPDPLPVDDLFASLTELYRNIKPGVTVTYNCSESMILWADPQLIRQVLTNLLDNAVEASSAGQTVSLGAEMGEDSLTITVSDEGRGIPEDEHEQVFQPYFSTKKRGSGLGLSIVERIVRDHNGIVTIARNQPCGTQFIITLPRIEFAE